MAPRQAMDAVALHREITERLAAIDRLLTITNKIRITMPLAWHNAEHMRVSVYRLVAPALLVRT